MNEEATGKNKEKFKKQQFGEEEPKKDSYMENSYKA